MATFDTSMYQNQVHFQPPDQMNQLAKVMQLRQAQQDAQLSDMKMAEYKRGQDDDAQMRALTRQSGGNLNKLQELLYQNGNYKQGSTVQSQVQALAKQKAEAEKLNIEGHFKKLELVGQLMGGVKDQASYDAMRQQAASIPELADLAPKMPPVYDPQAIEAGRIKAMSVKDALAARHQELSLMETMTHNRNSEGIQVRGQDMTAATAKAGHAVTMRGQNMTDARAREFNAATREANAIKAAEPKPLNDSQSKALLFGERMRQADAALDGLSKSGVTTSIPGSRTPLIGSAINAVQSGDRQMLDQAKRDFMSAVLRRESGAAISSGEYESADRQYFPQVGDGPQVIAQKAANRKLAIEGVLAEVPKAHREAIRPQAAPPGNSNIDALLNKYK